MNELLIISNRFDDNSDEHNFVQHQMFTIIWSTHTDNLNKFLFHPINIPSQRNVTIPACFFFLFCIFFLKFGLETEFITLAPVYGFEDTRPWMGDKINYFIWTTIMKRTAIKKNKRINWMEREREKKMSMNWNDIPINKKTAVSIHKCKHTHARTHAMRCKIYSF